MRTSKGDGRAVRLRGASRRRRRFVRFALPALAAALVVAIGLSCARKQGPQSSPPAGPGSAGGAAQPAHDAHAKPHPHVNKPAAVAVGLNPAQKHEVVTGGDTKKVFHWDVAKEPAKRIGTYHKTHEKKVAYVATWLAQAGTDPGLLFQASYDGTVVVSKLRNFGNANQAFVTEFTHPPAAAGLPDVEAWCVAASPDSALAVSGTNYGQIKLWETKKARAATTVGEVPGQPSFSPVGGLAFLPAPAAGKPQQFIAAHDGGEVILYNVVPVAGGTYRLDRAMPPMSHENDLAVNAVAVTRRGDKAVSGGFDMTVRVWNLATGAQIAEIDKHEGLVWRVAISPDDQMIASASDDGSVRLFNIDGTEVMENGAPAIRKEVDTDGTPLGIMGVVFVTDTKVVYTVGKDPPNPNDPDVRVWDISALKPQRQRR